MRKLSGLVVCGGILVAAMAGAQVPDRMEIYSSGGASALMAAPVLNEPYSALQQTTRTKPLLDGATQRRTWSHLVTRDSQGRVRLEEVLHKGVDGQPDMKRVYLKDPVAHTLSVWMEGLGAAKVATIEKTPEHEVVPVTCKGCASNDGPLAKAVETDKDLGANVMDSLAVKGTLYTIQILNSGADRPVYKTHEMWVSEEMKLVMRQTWEDPRNGEKVVELKDFKRGEPAQELFRLPAGYTTETQVDRLKKMVAKMEVQE